ncbi:MAG: DNA topoisomerase III [Gammaproteobacteria bacterium]|nr:DNA topoisomerase III [Gammaproteobacteria bacterium]MBQ0839219.1 DNA topoisomerase III [Gammaproteobacteria bacterium]
MKLYIAEKPSLGRAIADVLPKPHRRDEGCIWVGDGDCVSWCIGHLLEQVEPDVYKPQYKKWTEHDLPIVPEQWQLAPKTATRKQLTVLRKLLKQAVQIVHAGDPDREGQLLVDEVVNYLGVSATKKAAMQRLLISDLNPAAVRRALASLRSNREFIPLSTSALARSRADWLYGINLTRASTLQGRKVGYTGVLSVGRVQTPLLGLVVRRDHDIDNFVSKPFYEVLAHLQEGCEAQPLGSAFYAKWQASEACQPQMDDEGRVLSRALAENVVRRISGQPGEVKSVKNTPGRQAPPLPYSLSALQIDAGKAFSMSAQQVLDSCQALYERHKLITYPRSDSRYLPLEHYGQAQSVLSAITQVASELQDAVAGADTGLKSKAWNDAKVKAHHAIIPTAKKMQAERLSAQETKLYGLIARQYILQFYPPHTFTKTVIDIVIAGGCFRAQATVVKELGWKALLPAKKTRADVKPSKDAQQCLPALKKGDVLHCLKGECVEKHTQAPSHFTDATLLAAMTGIARFVHDNEVRKILKDTDGLGTEATRAGIIELLFRRNFLRREGKQIRATDAGRGLINSLPESTTLPDMTARWESILNAIVEERASYSDFMGGLIPTLHSLVKESCGTLPLALKGVPASKPAYRKSGKKRAAAKPRRKKPASSSSQ